MKIVSLTASNLKKLTAVELKPGTNNVLEVTGKNGQGKSSVLDAIWYTLGGGDAIGAEPVKHGAEQAEVVIHLDDGFIVTRKFTHQSSSLVVKNQDGAKYPSPQALLDKFLGKLTFDPLAFINLHPAQQVNELLRLVGIGPLLDQLSQEDGKDQSLRRDLTRDLKQREGALAQVTRYLPSNLPAEPIDIDVLVAAQEEVTTVNHAADLTEQEHRRKNEDLKHRINIIQTNVTSLRSEIERMRREIANAESQIVGAETRIHNFESAIAAPWQPPSRQDPGDLRQQIADATETNRWIEVRDRRERLSAEIQDLQNQISDLNFQINERQATREQKMSEAKWPLPNLTADGDGVRYQGVPLSQASSAEQLRVSCALAMAMNPKLRVILIRDGSLLDHDNLRVIQELAKEHDYQVWVERIEAGLGEPLVVLEDGLAK